MVNKENGTKKIDRVGYKLSELVPLRHLNAIQIEARNRLRKILINKEILKKRILQLKEEIRTLKEKIRFLEAENNALRVKIEHKEDIDKMKLGIGRLKETIRDIIGLHDADIFMKTLETNGIKIRPHRGEEPGFDIIFKRLTIHVSTCMNIINDYSINSQNIPLSKQYDLFKEFIDKLNEIKLPKKHLPEEILQKRIESCLRSYVEQNEHT